MFLGRDRRDAQMRKGKVLMAPDVYWATKESNLGRSCLTRPISAPRLGRSACSEPELARPIMNDKSDIPLTAAATAPAVRPTLMGHIQIARIDHWFKNVFVLPGIVFAVAADPKHIASNIWGRIVLGMISVCLVASSNYVVNEVLDAPSDLAHPVKCKRPVPSGRVNIPLAYAQWIALMVVGVSIGYTISKAFALTV